MPGSRLDLGRQQSNRGFSKQLPRIFASAPLHLQAEDTRSVSEVEGATLPF